MKHTLTALCLLLCFVSKAQQTGTFSAGTITRTVNDGTYFGSIDSTSRYITKTISVYRDTAYLCTASARNGDTLIVYDRLKYLLYVKLPHSLKKAKKLEGVKMAKYNKAIDINDRLIASYDLLNASKERQCIQSQIDIIIDILYNTGRMDDAYNK